MARKNSEEIEEDIEEKKIRTKQFNIFLSDYFNWIVAGIVAVVFLFGFFALLLPKYEQAVNYIRIVNQQQVSDTSAKLDELNKTEQLIAAYKNIDKKYVDKVNAIAPAVQNKEELFSELNYLVSVNQLFLQSVSLSVNDGYQDFGLLPISPEQQKIADSLQTVTVTLSVAGIKNYETYKNFLTALENNLRLMDVLNISFTPNAGSTSFTINTYYSKY
ncbi:MAG: hypothetical protein PHO56_00845 [Patescibacteria group bacterium]|nr:hypothetical protein [Patescibacteria group bacterium]